MMGHAIEASVGIEGDEGTLVDVVRRRARTEPERTACIFIRDGEEDECAVRYGELDARAAAIAATLERTVPESATALLAFEPGPEFVAAFLGCLYAGVVAVPVLPPDPRDPAGVTARLRRIAADADAVTMLTTRAVAHGLPAGDGPVASALVIDELSPDAGADWRPARRSDVAFLQYTSGSTGTPRGVAVTHANIVAHGARVAAVLRLDADAVAVSWLPVCHDMGLIGTLLIPLQIGFRTVQMSPRHFLERPVRWLRAISRHRGTLSPAPNFAYDLVARKTDERERRSLALDSWRAAMNGAEPIRARTCERFVAAFEVAGFRREAFVPCYGLAEATLMVAGGPLAAGPVACVVDGPALDAGRVRSLEAGHPRARTLVASGAPLSGVTVRIVDPESGAPLTAADRVGEVCVAGATVAAGYWRRPDETRRTFGSVGDGGTLLRTGDLGFIADGMLFVTGRCKDLIVVRGRNHHPHDLEDTAGAAHPALRAGGGAAFAVDDGDAERVVIVHETDAEDRDTLAAAARAIRVAVLRDHGLAVAAVVLLPPRALPKTTSGKVRRRACRELLAAGELPLRFEDRGVSCPAVADVERALMEIVAEIRDLPRGRVRPDTALAWLGVDSAEAAEVAVRLEARLGRRVPIAMLMAEPTIARVAAALCEVAP